MTTRESDGGGRPPVFVVGPSRSGTTLVQEVLNQHPDLWVARETHYFDDLRPRLGEGATAELSAADAARCARYFLALGHRVYGHSGDPEQSQIDAAELQGEAERLGGSGDGYFEAYCRIRARHHGKAFWGEKTPRHVFRIDEMLGLWPEAKVLCLVRDPRGVAASYRDWKRGKPRGSGDDVDPGERRRAERSYNVVLNAILWRGAMRASLRAFHSHGPDRVRLMRYEELVSDPQKTVQTLSDWLGLEYHEGMLDVPVAYSSYTMPEAGISTTPRERWRTRLTPTEVAAVQICCGRLMEELGYRKEATDAKFNNLAWTFLTAPLAAGRAAIANRSRLGKASEYLRKRLLLALPGRN